MLVVAYSRVSEDELRALRVVLDLAGVHGYFLNDVSAYDNYESLRGKPLIVIGASLAKRIAVDVHNGFGIINKPSKALQETGFAGLWEIIKGFLPNQNQPIIENDQDLVNNVNEFDIPPGVVVKVLCQNSQVCIHGDENFKRTSPFDISVSEYKLMKEFLTTVPDAKWVIL